MKALIAALLISMVAGSAQAEKLYAGTNEALKVIQGKDLGVWVPFRKLSVDEVDVVTSKKFRGQPATFTVRVSTWTTLGFDVCEFESSIYSTTISGRLRPNVHDKNRSRLLFFDLDKKDGQIYLDDEKSTNITPLFNVLRKAAQELSVYDGMGIYSETFTIRDADSRYQINERDAQRLLRAFGDGNLVKGRNVLHGLKKLCEEQSRR